MSQYGLFFDQSRCIGCHACAVACKTWHGLPPGPLKYLKIYEYEKGSFPNVRLHYQWIPCYHCEKPACVEVCPFGAIEKEERFGAVLIDQEKCIGCRLCYDACPYGAPVFESDKVCKVSGDGQHAAPCSEACPAGVNIPQYIRCIREGKPDEAVAVLREKLPFPSICGRVCLHPCETKCNRMKINDDPVSIRVLKRYATDHDTGLWKQRITMAPASGKKVAIIGSGPAGLTAAYYLVKKGHKVTVFEALPVAGGMMRVGIPRYRLRDEVLDKEIKEVENVGVEIKLNSKVSSIKDLLQQGFDVVFVGVGAHQGLKLGISGEDLPGVMESIEFLRRGNLGERINVGENIGVIGGGNVAIDAARMALRFGARKVTMFYRRTRAEMPASPEEVEAALKENIEIVYLAAPNKVTREGNKVRLECIRMKLGEPDASGRARPVPVKCSEFTIDLDILLVAIGQHPDVPKKMKVETAKGDTIVVDANMMTTQKGIFSGGDCVSGPASVVEAIAAGRKAAVNIDKYLGGNGIIDEVLARPIAEETPLKEVDVRRKRVSPKALKMAERRRSFDEVELPVTDSAAINEAKRCFECDPNKAQKCNMCIDRLEIGEKPICVLACPTRALDFGPLSTLNMRYGDSSDLEDMPNSLTTKPSIVFKPHTKKKQLVPYDVERALELMIRRDPLPPVLKSPADLRKIPEGAIGRGRLVVKHKSAADLMRYTRSDEG